MKGPITKVTNWLSCCMLEKRYSNNKTGEANITVYMKPAWDISKGSQQVKLGGNIYKEGLPWP